MSIDALELQLAQDPFKHLNNLAALVTHAAEGNVAAVHSCRRCFTLLIQAGRMNARDKSEAELTVLQWLAKQLATFESALLAALEADSLPNAVVALRTAMHMASLERLVDAEAYGRRLICATVRRVIGKDDLMDVLASEFVTRFADVRYCFYGTLRAKVRALDTDAATPDELAAVLQALLAPGPPATTATTADVDFMTTPPDTKVAKPGVRRRVFDEAWLEFLRLDLPAALHLKVLGALNTHVLPALRRPLLLGDYLIAAFDASEETPLLAMGALFTLIRDHRLDYAGYYARLYELTTEAMFMSGKRHRFCELLDASLQSSHLEMNVVGAFCKRLCRLALRSPPACALFALPVVYNLVLRHPFLISLVHAAPVLKAERAQDSLERVRAASRALALGLPLEDDGNTLRDVFVERERHPAKSCAMRSQLWEIEALQRHYHPQVATLARQLFAHDVNKARRAKPPMAVPPMASVSYSALIAKELRSVDPSRKRVKQAPLQHARTDSTWFAEHWMM